MSTVRQKQKTSKRFPNPKLLTAMASIIVAALLGLWIGQDGFRTSPKRLDEGEIRLHFIDVGQGDATLIQTEAGHILIDAGTGASEDYLRAYLDTLGIQISEDYLRAYLDTLGIQSLRYAIFTHPDEDHIGGADMILRCFEVEQVILSPAEVNSRAYQAVIEAARQQGSEILWAAPDTVLRLGDVSCTILAPLRLDYEETNNASIVLRMDYGETSALFTGDAELVVESELLARYGSDPNGTLDCDLIKVGHHGSQTSSGQAFLQAVTPDFGVISCGEGNPHGHPAPGILTAYRSIGATVYRTDLEGSIVFSSTGGEPSRLLP